jgi:hypothetical protein
MAEEVKQKTYSVELQGRAVVRVDFKADSDDDAIRKVRINSPELTAEFKDEQDEHAVNLNAAELQDFVPNPPTDETLLTIINEEDETIVKTTCTDGGNSFSIAAIQQFIDYENFKKRISLNLENQGWELEIGMDGGDTTTWTESSLWKRGEESLVLVIQGMNWKTYKPFEKGIGVAKIVNRAKA